MPMRSSFISANTSNEGDRNRQVGGVFYLSRNRKSCAPFGSQRSHLSWLVAGGAVPVTGFRAPPPYPESGGKLLDFNEMRCWSRSKYVILLEFAAESSWQRGCRCFDPHSAAFALQNRHGKGVTGVLLRHPGVSGREGHYESIVRQVKVIICSEN